MKLTLTTDLEASPDAVWDALGRTSTLVHVASPLVRFAPLQPETLPERWSEGSYQVAMSLLGVVPLGRQWIRVSRALDGGARVLRDAGSGAIARTWDHRIRVEPGPRGGTRYTDEVEVEAGALTPVVGAFARVFYRHRQRRWRALARTLEGRAYWERHATRYDLSMRVLGGAVPRMCELVADAVRGARVLEIGAGTGLVTLAMARTAREVVATDYADAMIATLEGKLREAELANVRCERANVAALRFAPGSFDVVVAANVLHLLPDLDDGLASLRAMIQPGGRLVVPTYCHDETARSRVLSRVLAVSGFPGRRRFTTSTLCGAIERTGLRITRVETLPGAIPIAFVEAMAVAR